MEDPRDSREDLMIKHVLLFLVLPLVLNVLFKIKVIKYSGQTFLRCLIQFYNRLKHVRTNGSPNQGTK